MPAIVPDYGKMTQAALRPALVGTIDFFVAPPGTLFDAATGVNGGWVPLGRIKPGSFSNDLAKEMYHLMSGVPETRKESFVTGVSGKLGVTLIEPTTKAFEVANGGVKSKNLFQATSPVATTVATGTAADQFTLTAATGFVVGDEIEVVTPNGSENTYIAKIAGAVIDVFPKLSAIPAASAAVKRVDGSVTGAGGSTITEYAVRTVFTATTNVQVVTWGMSAVIGGIKDNPNDGKKEMEIPIECEFKGFTDTADFPTAGPIVAKKYILRNGLLLTY